MHILKVELYDTPEQAPHYARDSLDVRSAEITKVVIVGQGTTEGNPTVDLQFVTQDGDRFVAMTTGKLIKQLAAVVIGMEERL